MDGSMNYMDGSKFCYFKAHLKYSRDGAVVKSVCSSSIGPEFGSQHQHQAAHTVTTVPLGLMPSFGLCGNCTLELCI